MSLFLYIEIEEGEGIGRILGYYLDFELFSGQFPLMGNRHLFKKTYSSYENSPWGIIGIFTNTTCDHTRFHLGESSSNKSRFFCFNGIDCLWL